MNLKISITVGAIMAAGVISQQAMANIIPADVNFDLTNDVTLLQHNNGTGFVTVDSSATYQLTGPEAGEFEYLYSFSGTEPLISMSVYFNTALGLIDNVGASPTPTLGTNQVEAGEVNWTFNPATNAYTLYFYTPIVPTLGDISAQDGGLWGDGLGDDQYGVVIPNVPDGGATLMMLGGALVGLGALRRKLQK